MEKAWAKVEQMRKDGTAPEVDQYEEIIDGEMEAAKADFESMSKNDRVRYAARQFTRNKRQKALLESKTEAFLAENDLKPAPHTDVADPFKLYVPPEFTRQGPELSGMGMASVLRRQFDQTETLHGAAVQGLSVMSTWGAFGLAAFQLPFVINFFWSCFAGERVGANPWEATTLEWSAPSPPPHGNFLSEPVVACGPYEYSVPGEAEDYTMQSPPSTTA